MLGSTIDVKLKIEQLFCSIEINTMSCPGRTASPRSRIARSSFALSHLFSLRNAASPPSCISARSLLMTFTYNSTNNFPDTPGTGV